MHIKLLNHDSSKYQQCSNIIGGTNHDHLSTIARHLNED